MTQGGSTNGSASPRTSPLTITGTDSTSVIGLSNGAQTAYTGFAAIARFNPSGNIDARRGGSYAAASTIPCTAGTTYHFPMVVDTSAHTYSILVTPAGGGFSIS